MNIITLSPLDLSLTGLLILIVLATSMALKLQLSKQIIVASLRTVFQLLLVGLILRSLFTHVNLIWIIAIALIMILIAVKEVGSRLNYTFTGYYSYGISFIALLTSNIVIILYALLVVIRVHPWYQPQYVIPLLGMIIGNALSGITISLDHLTQTVHTGSNKIEQKLMLGYTAKAALQETLHQSIKKGMIPTLNAMAIAGVVSLPGMMTGQILAGISPLDAVKYQIMILFLICASTTAAIIIATHLAAKRLFDSRDRLRAERLISS